MQFGDETVLLLEVDQQDCPKTWGLTTAAGSCSAVLSASSPDKCRQSRASCPVPLDYVAGVKTIRYCRPQDDMIQYGPVIPLLSDVTFTPTSINLGGMDRSKSSFGVRAALRVTFMDGLHSDLQMDPYRLERLSGAAQFSGIGYDPYLTGTYWTKWLARHPYHASYRCRLYIGKVGDAIADMRVHHYVVEKFDGPNGDVTTMTAKDLFSLVERRKAVAPVASRGSLLLSITNVAASATLTPAGIGNLDYPASGYVRIGQEVCAFTRAGDVLTLTRAQKNTVAAAHSNDDAVQLVLSFVAQKGHDISYILLTQYGNVPSANINKPAWDAQAISLTDLYTTDITEPTPVLDLVGELEEEAGFTLIPNIYTDMVDLVTLRSAVASPTVDEKWISEGTSVAFKKLDTQRVSQMWVYYGQVDPTKKVDQKDNYAAKRLSTDPEAQGANKYGTPSIREIFSRWIPRFGGSQAQAVGDRLLTMFLDPPIEAKFNISALRYGELSYARLYSLLIPELADMNGNATATAHAPIEITDGEDELTIKSQSVAFALPPDPTAETVVHLDAPTNTVVMRSVWDLLYPAPVAGQQVTFEVDPGIDLGAINTSNYALDTGDWPVGTILKLRIKGRVEGAGGYGGYGGSILNGYSGQNGEAGGPALKVRVPLLLDNLLGRLYGGAGGGGGGASGIGPGGIPPRPGGGGGGAGTGIIANGGGAAGVGVAATDGAAGGSSTADAPGAGGAGGVGSSGVGGDGGSGGGYGAAGAGGNPPAGTFPGGVGTPGTGGAAGNYIDGIAFVTWVAHGDERGNVI